MTYFMVMQSELSNMVKYDSGTDNLALIVHFFLTGMLRIVYT